VDQTCKISEFIFSGILAVFSIALFTDFLRYLSSCIPGPNEDGWNMMVPNKHSSVVWIHDQFIKTDLSI